MGKRHSSKKQKTRPEKLLFLARNFLPFVFFILFSCSSISVQIGFEAVIINKVPFYPQEAYQCGPASLSGVMNYWGVNVTPEEIAGEVYSKTAKGTLNLDMLIYANTKGLYALQYAGTMDDIKTKINNGYPLIVMVDYGFSIYQVNHFMVVVGYNDNGVIVNSGRTEHEFINREKFLNIWEKTNFWTLLIKKKSEEK
ncbi:MAG: C39 family peptidase [Thermodesulfovibrionales bacterium]|nr:C39 family peptidase [Thermodesulfovibrionales bacterium]